MAQARKVDVILVTELTRWGRSARFAARSLTCFKVRIVSSPQMQAIQIQAMIQGSDAFDAAISEIESELNADQQKRLEKFRERRRANLQESIAKRQEQQQ